MSLNREDDFQIPCVYSVVKEFIIVDLLKFSGQHIHQETANKFGITEGNLPFLISWLFAPCGKSGLCLCDGQNPAVGIGNLMCVPAKVFDGIGSISLAKAMGESPPSL